jgi:hypothetical protein
MSTRRAIGIYRSSSGPAPAPSEYYLRTVIPDNQAYFPRADGCGAIFYQGLLYKSKGWNGSGAFDPWKASDEWQTSADEGKTWVDIDPMPVHAHGFGVRVKNDKIWIWGMAEDVDGVATTPFLCTFDPVNGWVSINLTLDLPISYAALYVEFNGEMYKLGGQNDINTLTPTADPTIYKINDDGTTVLIGTCPENFMTASTGSQIGSKFYFGWGGELSSAAFQYNSLVTKIYETSDLISWTEYATIPVGQRGIWCDTQVFDGKLWQINGSFEGANRTGLFYSSNKGLTWTTFSGPPSARHLTSMPVTDDYLYLICGNDKSDVLRIEKVTIPDSFPDIFKPYYFKLYSADRPTGAYLTGLITLGNRLQNTLSLNGVTSQADEIDLLIRSAGTQVKNQFLLPLITTNTDFANECEEQGTPTYTTTGVHGDGVNVTGSGYKILWGATNNAVKYQLNFGSSFLYSLSTNTEDTQDFGGNTSFIACRQNNGSFYANLNDNFEASTAVPNGKGYRGASRFDSTNREIVFNKTHVASTQASTQFPTSFTSLCGIYIGSNFYSSVKTYGACGYGSADLDHDELQDALEEYFTITGVSF